MKNPVLALQKRIWRIENNPLRRLAAIAVTVSVVPAAWLLNWLALIPACWLLYPLFLVGKAVWQSVVELIFMTLASVKAEPKEWRHRVRTFRALWRSSESVWKARQPTVVRAPRT